MKKITWISILMLIVSIPTFAGGLLTNTNQHVLFLRMLARNASTEIDAVYSNPAGVAFMENGWHLSFNAQSAYQTRKITSTFAPFAMNGNEVTKHYKGEASAPIIPSLYGAYVTDRWSISGNFAISGGGGKATFNDGLGSFESIVSMVPIIANTMSSMLPGLDIPTINRYSVDSYMQGRQYIFGLQLGATYKITDYLSVFAGGRMNYVSNHYKGYLRDIQIGFADGGSMVNASQAFGELAQEVPAPYKSSVELLAGATADKEVDCKQKGWGITPILGADFKMGKWNVGVKYEFKTKLNIENNTTINTTGFKDYDHGVNTPHDIPSLLTVGVSYNPIPEVQLAVGYHHFFDSSAKMANGKEQYTGNGTNEYLGGISWDVTKWLQLSTGMQRTKYGVQDDYQTDMSFSISSYSYGLGAGFNITPNLQLNVAYFWTKYDTYTKNMDNYNYMSDKLESLGIPSTIAQAIKIEGQDKFTRTNKVFGIGIDYRF